jgi:hypothetical protein
MNASSPPSVTVRDWRFATRDGALEVTGSLLAYQSTYREDEHSLNHPGARHAERGDKCRSCRWFEVRILLVEADDAVEHGGRFLVYTVGRSLVPGEVDLIRAAFTDSPYTVVELLTQRDGGRPFLPASSARALADAAAHDLDLRDAYTQRSVA